MLKGVIRAAGHPRKNNQNNRGKQVGVPKVVMGTQKREAPAKGVSGGLLCRDSLALTYFLTGNRQYHGRGGVSRSCSGWEGVVPPCYGHQTEGGVSTRLRVGDCDDT